MNEKNQISCVTIYEFIGRSEKKVSAKILTSVCLYCSLVFNHLNMWKA